jgi:hypothetical protein
MSTQKSSNQNNAKMDVIIAEQIPLTNKKGVA